MSASRRCVVNVAVHHETYLRRQRRLLESLVAVGYRDGLAVWSGELPLGSPPHDEVHYGFKAYAIAAAAARGYTTLLWIDSGPFFLRHPAPLFEKIERCGVWLFHGTECLARWASDAALARFGITRDEAEAIPFCGGSTYGFDLTCPLGRAFVEDYLACVEDERWQGPFINTGPNAAAARAGLGPRSEGHVSDDPRCYGHRQDETVLSALAYRYGLKVEPGGDWGGKWVALDTPENLAREEIYIVTGRDC